MLTLVKLLADRLHSLLDRVITFLSACLGVVHLLDVFFGSLDLHLQLERLQPRGVRGRDSLPSTDSGRVLGSEPLGKTEKRLVVNSCSVDVPSLVCVHCVMNRVIGVVAGL